MAILEEFCMAFANMLFLSGEQIVVHGPLVYTGDMVFQEVYIKHRFA